MKHWQYWFHNFVTYYSLSISATTIRIDLKTRQLVKSSLWLKLYVVFGNLLFLCWLPHAIRVNLSHSQLYATNPMATYANYASIAVRVMVLLVTVCSRHQRDVELANWLEAVLLMQSAYLDRFAYVPKDTAHRKWLYLNCILSFFHIAAVFAEMLQALCERQMLIVLDLYPLYGMVAFQHLYMLFHGALLCYLRESLSILNNQLRLDCMDPKLSLIYCLLRDMLQRLNVIFSPVILWTQLCLILYNSMAGYIGVVMLIFPQMSFSNYNYLFGSRLYFCLLVHMYSYFMICDWVAATATETGIILYEYTTRRSDQEIEKISFSCGLYKAGVNISGMFDINLNTLFSIVAQTYMYTIILVQDGYANNRNK